MAVNTLKRPEWIKLLSWASDHKAELATMHAKEAAEAASKAVGFTVTTWNMRSICKDAGIPLKLSRDYRRGEQPDRYHKRLEFLASQIFNLNRIVEELHASLGANYPQGRLNINVLQQMRVGVTTAFKDENEIHE